MCVCVCVCVRERERERARVFDLDTCFGLVGKTNAQDENSRGSSYVVGDFPSFPLVLLVRLCVCVCVCVSMMRGALSY